MGRYRTRGEFDASTSEKSVSADSHKPLAPFMSTSRYTRVDMEPLCRSRKSLPELISTGRLMPDQTSVVDVVVHAVAGTDSVAPSARGCEAGFGRSLCSRRARRVNILSG